MSLPRWLPLVAFSLALAAAVWRAPVADLPAFAAPEPTRQLAVPALFQANLLPKTSLLAATPTVTQLPDGRLAAAWFGGNEAAASDGGIWFSLYNKGGWSDPVLVANRESTAGGTFSHVRSVGAPLLHAEGSWLHLWYGFSGPIGGLSGSLAHVISTDGGKRWSVPVRLQTSPLGPLHTQARNPPVAMADGGLGLPVHHDVFYPHGAWLRFSATGQLIDKARMTQVTSARQPAVLASDGSKALALLRDAGAAPGRVRVARTDNAGRYWHAEDALSVPNPDTALALLRLPSGRLLLAGNSAAGSSVLVLWLSDLAGKDWQLVQTLENAADAAASFADPALLLGRDGTVHLLYAWRQQAIKHVRFNEAWLTGESS
jgi:predicted neuraminidase